MTLQVSPLALAEEEQDEGGRSEVLREGLSWQAVQYCEFQ